MAWPLIASMAASVIGGAMQGKGEEAKAKYDAETQKEIARIQANEERRTMAYRDELGDYYSQKNKQRRRDSRAKSFGGFSTRTKFKEPEGFERKPLVPDEAPGVPITQTVAGTPATYKKPSLWQRLTKPSLDPLGIGPGNLGPRGDLISAGTPGSETVVRQRLGG